MQRLYGLFFGREPSTNTEMIELASVHLNPSDIPNTLEGDARTAYIARLVAAIKYLREESAEERLARENFDETLIPETFHDHQTHRILRIPYKNIGLVDDTHPSIIDESTATNYFAHDPRYVLDQTKCVEFAAFVRAETEKLQRAAYIRKIRVELDELENFHRDEINRRLERFELLSQQIELADLPDEVIDPISSDLLSFPVQIKMNNPADGGYVIDWSSLKQWWDQHPNKYRHPLYDGEVSKVTFSETRFQLVGRFISLLEQLAAVKQVVAELGSPKSHHETLAHKKVLPEQVPDRLIKCNLSGEIMTHPIVLDKKYLVDFHHYLNWMNDPTHPERRFKNFFTDQIIETMAYEYKLKAELDAFVKEPTAPKETLRSQPLIVKRLLRTATANHLHDASRTNHQPHPTFSLLQTHWKPLTVIRALREDSNAESTSPSSAEACVSLPRPSHHSS